MKRSFLKQEIETFVIISFKRLILMILQKQQIKLLTDDFHVTVISASLRVFKLNQTVADEPRLFVEILFIFT